MAEIPRGGKPAECGVLILPRARALEEALEEEDGQYLTQKRTVIAADLRMLGMSEPEEKMEEVD